MPLIITKHQAQNQYYDEIFAEGVLSLRMMLIPSGTFLMGSPKTGLERFDFEEPQHEVTLAQFFMSKYPVTQAQWQFVAGLPQVNQELKLNPSEFKGNKRPVESVSWYDTIEFCERLSIHTERAYRLPSESEWEYACRANPIFIAGISKPGDTAGDNTNQPFHFGEVITTDLANYDGTGDPDGKWSSSYGRGTKGKYRKETTPVDQFEGANAFGLCDMHGNVWEWCQDHWHDDYISAPIDGSAWLTDDGTIARVCRGGAWDSVPRDCRSASRLDVIPHFRNPNVGFRVCCSGSRTQ